MGKKLTATLTTAALLGAGIYGGNYLGDQLNAEMASATATSNTPATAISGPGTANTDAGKETSAPAGSQSRPMETIDEIYNRVRAERDIAAEREELAYLESGVLPDYNDPRYSQVVQRHVDQAEVADKDNYPDNPWLTWDKAAPGMAINMSRSEGRTSACTLGFIGERDGKYFGLTAGHCMQGSGKEVSWKRAGEPSLEPLGTYLTGQVRDNSLSDNAPFTTDFAAITLGDVPGDMAVAKTYTVVDVYDANDLAVGMEVCKLGYRTEETCGPVMAKNESIVRVNLFSLSGDSGAPAYVKLGDNKIAAVGLLSGSPERDGVSHDSVTDFSLVAPILRHTGLDLMPYLR